MDRPLGQKYEVASLAESYKYCGTASNQLTSPIVTQYLHFAFAAFAAADRMRKAMAQPAFTACRPRATARASSGTSPVITTTGADIGPVADRNRRDQGRVRADESPSPMIVQCLLKPS